MPACIYCDHVVLSGTGGLSPKLSRSCAVPQLEAKREARILTEVPLMISVVAMRYLRPFACFDIHLKAEISVYVHPPRKNTTVVIVCSFSRSERLA